MSHTSNTLNAIISQSFSGRKTDLASITGLTSGTITKLSKGDQSLTSQTLSKICNHLSPADSKSLALAACRDLIPDELATNITFQEDSNLLHESTIQYGLLDPETETIFKKLRALCARDEDMRTYMHIMAKWVFPTNTNSNLAAAPDPEIVDHIAQTAAEIDEEENGFSPTS